MNLIHDHLRTRRLLWASAERDWRRRAGDPLFLAGTLRDRQDAATTTHRYRRRLGVDYLPPMDHALPDTKAVDGSTRRKLHRMTDQELVELFRPRATAVRAGTYRPGLLTGARWPKGDDPEFQVEQLRLGLISEDEIRWRVILYPSEVDKVVHAVLLEIIEPLLDSILHPHQHAYRSSRIAGRHVPPARGFIQPRGAPEAVIEGLYRAINAGRWWLAYMDVINAFPSVVRDILVEQLVADGCPESFAVEIATALGTDAYVHWLKGHKGKKNQEVTGIPLGSPLGPLLFNFYVRSAHLMPNEIDGVVHKGFADDSWGVGFEESQVVELVEVVRERLNAVGLDIKKDIYDLTDGRPRTVLQRWEFVWNKNSEKVEVTKTQKKPSPTSHSPLRGRGGRG